MLSVRDSTQRVRPAVLVFVSTACGPCLELLPSLGRWQESLAGSVTVAAIFAGERDDVERLCAEHGLGLALAQKHNEVFELYKLRATPSAVLVGVDGVIAGAPAHVRTEPQRGFECQYLRAAHGRHRDQTVLHRRRHSDRHSGGVQPNHGAKLRLLRRLVPGRCVCPMRRNVGRRLHRPLTDRLSSR
jgi:thiol-disulfide isomerase/thioredoxin